MINPFHRPSLVFFLAAAVVTGFIGFLWLPQTPSGEELYGDTGRYVHEFQKLFLSGAPQWWSADFLSGHSSAPYLGFLLPSLVGTAAGALFGDWVALKIVLLLSLALGAGGVFLLVARLTGDRWTGAIAGILSLLSPQILLRAGDFEHYHSVICVSLIPFALWAVSRLVDHADGPSRVGTGMIFSAIILSYPKLSLMVVPMGAFFLSWLWFSNPAREGRRRLLVGLGTAMLVTFLCAGFFLAPMTREYQWMALFQPEELAGWQKSFSIKSMVSIIDRNGFLSAGMPEYFRADRGQFYLGLVAMVAGLALWKDNYGRWLATKQGSVFRLFVGMGILSLWLAHGPYSPCTGTIEFLSRAQRVPDWVPAVAWAVSVLPGLVIFAIFPEGRLKLLGAGVSIAVYYLVPGFLLLEKLPFYRDIRAPWGFWEVAFFTIPAASAGAVRVLLEQRNGGGGAEWKSKSGMTAVALVLVVGLLDMSGYLGKFRREGLPRDLFRDFSFIGQALRDSPLEGRVYPVSGRYFDLRTPLESGRGLATEASWAHFQMKPYSEMFRVAHKSADTISSYFRIAGVSHMIVDKKSPFIPANFWRILEKTFRKAEDSEYIGLWENPQALAPGFLAKNHIAVETFDPNLIEMLMEIAGWLPVIAVELPQEERKLPYLIGKTSPDKKLNIDIDKATKLPLKKTSYATPRNSPSEFSLSGVGGEGPSWIVATEAWHPDWKAEGRLGPLKVRRAFGGLMAVWVGPQDGDVRFFLKEPWWYNFCLAAGAFAWLTGTTYLVFVGGKRIRNPRSPSR